MSEMHLRQPRVTYSVCGQLGDIDRHLLEE